MRMDLSKIGEAMVKEAKKSEPQEVHDYVIGIKSSKANQLLTLYNIELIQQQKRILESCSKIQKVSRRCYEDVYVIRCHLRDEITKEEKMNINKVFEDIMIELTKKMNNPFKV